MDLLWTEAATSHVLENQTQYRVTVVCVVDCRGSLKKKAHNISQKDRPTDQLTDRHRNILTIIHTVKSCSKGFQGTNNFF